jgi:hypothetical protein
MMDVWICSSFVFLACVGFVDPSCFFGVLAYLFLFASSFPGIKLILDHVNFVTVGTPKIRQCGWITLCPGSAEEKFQNTGRNERSRRSLPAAETDSAIDLYVWLLLKRQEGQRWLLRADRPASLSLSL